MKNLTIKSLMLMACLLMGMSSFAKGYKFGQLIRNSKGEAEGIICYVSEDGKQAMALSLATKALPFGTKTIIDTPDDIALPELSRFNKVGQADDCFNFVKNTQQYKDGAYPAFKWAESLGEGWYVPTQGDWLECIIPAFMGEGVINEKGKSVYNLQTDLNENMVGAGGESFDQGNSEKVRYWTCNVSNDKPGAKARKVRPCYSDTFAGSKAGKTNVRAVKYLKK